MQDMYKKCSPDILIQVPTNADCFLKIHKNNALQKFVPMQYTAGFCLRNIFHWLIPSLSVSMAMMDCLVVQLKSCDMYEVS